MKRILILGIGNTLYSDDGFGPEAIRYLDAHWRFPSQVRLQDGGVLGLMLMGELLECDLALILDIILAENAPGTFYKLDDYQTTFKIRHSMHQANLEDVLVSCDLAGHRPQAILMGMEPFDYQTLSGRLSFQATERLPEFCQKVVNELVMHGVECSLKSSGEQGDD